jgi:hypothetical protein
MPQAMSETNKTLSSARRAGAAAARRGDGRRLDQLVAAAVTWLYEHDAAVVDGTRLGGSRCQVVSR